MTIIDALLARVGLERRDASSSADPYTARHIEGRAAHRGGDAVTGIPAVHACVQAIAETIATLPLSLYRRTDDGGREVANDHPLHRALHERANDVQTAMEFREQFIASCLLGGNSYAVKTLDSAGRVKALDPLPAGSTTAERLPSGRIRYRHAGAHGTRVYTQDEVLHLRYRTEDGVTGLSPITIARRTLENAAAQQEFESRFLSGGGRHMGFLMVDKILTENQREALRENFANLFDRPGSYGNRLAVLEQHMKFEPVTLTQRDAEFIESRRLTLDDIARIFRVPPPMIGILENATYANITEQSRMFVMHCLRPWLVRIEQAMNAALLTPAGRRTMFIEHSAEGLLRGSTSERFEAYRTASEWGWMNINEIRQLENMAGIGTAGDQYRVQMNTEALGGDAPDSVTAGGDVTTGQGTNATA